MDARTQLQNQVIKAIEAVVLTSEVTQMLGGIPVKGVHKLVDRPLTAEETPAVVVESGHESREYQEAETPPNRIVEWTGQAIVIVAVNAELKSFAMVVRRLSENVQSALSGFRGWRLGEGHLLDLQIAAVAPEDYPSATGRQAGDTLTILTKFWSRENAPGTILALR